MVLMPSFNPPLGHCLGCEHHFVGQDVESKSADEIKKKFANTPNKMPFTSQVRHTVLNRLSHVLRAAACCCMLLPAACSYPILSRLRSCSQHVPCLCVCLSAESLR